MASVTPHERVSTTLALGMAESRKMGSHTSTKLSEPWFIASLFDIRHQCHWQLTPIKKKECSDKHHVTILYAEI